MTVSKKGIIKFFKAEKGYGFIKCDDGNEYFFHISNMNIPEEMTPMKGDHVEFYDTHVSTRGYEAKGIELKGRKHHG